MNDELVKLEEDLNQLLTSQHQRRPSNELRSAAAAWSGKVWELGKTDGPAKLTHDEINAGLQLVKQPVFVCGVHRSGTTLVRDLLDGHPALVVLPSEGSFLTSISKVLKRLPDEEGKAFFVKEWLRRLVNPINQPPFWLLGRSTAAHSPYVAFARTCGSWLDLMSAKFARITSFWPQFALAAAYSSFSKSAHVQPAFWVDKTPLNERYADKIRREIPGAKFIQVLRSPADVLKSRLKMEPGVALRSCLKEMRYTYHLAAEKVSGADRDFLVIRYEDLCSYQQESMGRITNFLGIQLVPTLFEPTVAGKPARINSSFTIELPAGKIIDLKLHPATDLLTWYQEMLLWAYVSRYARVLGYSEQSLWRRRKTEVGHK